MADVFTTAKRSEIMSRIKARGNEATEIAFVRLLRTTKITGWRRHSAIFGNPDFAFAAERVVVFIDGCYWHGCPKHYKPPKTNRKFWSAKISRNRRRDRQVLAVLTAKGWRVVRLWQHELREPRDIMRKLSVNGIRGNRRARRIAKKEKR
jgi:DNA mismatch endonuclease (patch repair protein)